VIESSFIQINNISKNAMNISTAEKLSGLSCKTIRDYEVAGLIQPLRKHNGYRCYSEADIATLCFIKHA
jgi:MerR family transcriptional regulator, copper efflux regulator